ncbi:hypothetical protein AOLI_G00307480 [Acnodon oligacanthus]
MNKRCRCQFPKESVLKLGACAQTVGTEAFLSPTGQCPSTSSAKPQSSHQGLGSQARCPIPADEKYILNMRPPPHFTVKKHNCLHIVLSILA